MIPSWAIAAVVVGILAGDHAWVTPEPDDFSFGILASFRALRLEVVWGVLPLFTVIAGIFNGSSQLWALVAAWAAWASWASWSTYNRSNVNECHSHES
jgi:hypothetical protein